MRHRTVGVVVVLSGLLSGLLSGAGEPVGPDPVPPASTSPPTVTDEPAYGELLRAEPGTWSPESGLTYTYRWLRDGERIQGETGRRYRPTLRDLGAGPGPRHRRRGRDR
jgi:hypothetical protein